MIKEQRAGLGIDQKDGEGTSFHMKAVWELLLPSPMCCVKAVFCQVLDTLLTCFRCYSSCQKKVRQLW